jgi:hypothetical protein
VDEFELIRRYFVRQGRDDGVLVGIGDDGAVMMPAAGCALVSVVDTLVDGVHWPVELPPRRGLPLRGGERVGHCSNGSAPALDDVGVDARGRR